MIQLVTTTAQELTPGQAVSFVLTPSNFCMHCGNAEAFNSLVPTFVKLLGPDCAIFNLEFHGNITSAAAATAIQLALAVEGTALTNTAMNAVPAAAGDLWNVSAGTLFRPGCADLRRISVVNSGAANLTLAPGASLFIGRKS